METRTFGRIGAKVSIIAMGGCGVGFEDQADADKAIKLAMDHGINMIDVAPTYGNAEIRLKPWLEKYRDKFFLAVKTLKRNKSGALRHLNRSLERLGVKNFDLYQFHSVSTMKELDQILGERGAMEAFKEAKETGLIKHIGITGHADMRVLQKALENTDDFDTVLLPVYPAALINPSPVTDFRPILKIAQDRNIGVTAIKAISKGRWVGDTKYNTWYEPLDDQEMVDKAVWFTLSQDGVTTYSLPCDIKLWPLILDAVKRYHKLDAEERNSIINLAKQSNLKPLFSENQLSI